ncbi:PQQ-dependent sugar dehydrogenase [Lacipirellula sp.]|uniref:PQQ-dependent sugar dehydrogenase n=1 Tax=Lacipirellula sp. TaxID=2691419 RepID=UPI003D0F1820
MNQRPLTLSARAPSGRRRFALPSYASSLLAIATASCCTNAADAGVVGRELVAQGLNWPMYATFAPGDSQRLFVIERGSPEWSENATAAIRVIDLATGQLQETPYLTIPGVNNIGEGGVLGLAFHPDFQNNHKFYLSVTANDDDPVSVTSEYIREYSAPSANATTANPEFTPIISWAKPDYAHNAGWIGFGPNDGYLYAMSGDGGLGNDWGPGHTEPGGNAQDLTDNLLGKVLRLDVNRDDFPQDSARNYGIPYETPQSPGNPFAPTTPGEENPEGDDEIWAYGLRNPFRAGFDRATGDLWIGDVGQAQREEVNFQSGSSRGGENYGWRVREGSVPRDPNLPEVLVTDPVEPVYDYGRPGTSGLDPNFTGVSIVGGVPYRGPDPELQGNYFFADNAMNRLWMLTPATETSPQQVVYLNDLIPTDIGSPAGPAAISEDSVGNLYISYLYTGEIYRIVTDTLMPGDFNADAKVDNADLAIWEGNIGIKTGATSAIGDADGDGDVDGTDYLAWQRNYGWSSLNVARQTSSTVVPEPTSGVLLACGAIRLAAYRRRAQLLDGPTSLA